MSALMKTCSSWGRLPTERSMTMSRFETPTWFAARPTPGAAYMVTTMSSISFCSASSKSVTGAVGRRRTSSPNLMIGKTAKSLSLLVLPWATPLPLPLLHALDHRLDGVLGALAVELVQHFADAGVLRQRVVELLL